MANNYKNCATNRSTNELWTEYDYTFCEEQEWDVEFCSDTLGRTPVSIRKAKQKYNLTFHKPSLWEKGGKRWHPLAKEILFEYKRKHIEDKTPILQDEWFEIQKRLEEVEGFYRNYKQCDMQTEARRMVNPRQTEYARVDIHESWTVTKEPTDAKDIIEIECPVGHKFTHHFHAWTDKDIGCLACARKENTTLYFLDFGEFVKIGITVKTAEKRFQGIPFKTILTIDSIGWGHAHYIEQQIIKNNKDFATEPELLVGNGSTECFTPDAKQQILEELKQWQ